MTIIIQKWLDEDIKYVDKKSFNSAKEYASALDKMFNCNEDSFQDYPNIKLEEYDTNKKFEVRWEQKYDVEQLLGHAIVHILRHRR